MNKESLIESKISETGCNSIPMGLEYRFCHSIETHLRRKRSLLNFTTRKISEYAKEYLSEYKEGIRSMKYEKTLDFFKSRQAMVEVAMDMFKYCEGIVKYIEDHMKRFIEEHVIIDSDGEWSYLNKLNTNYSALAYLITKLRFDKDNMLDTDTIVRNFFNYDEKTGISPFIDFIDSIKPSVESESNKIMNQMGKTIKATTDYGNKAEEDVKNLLLDEYVDSEIYDFTGNYSFIDMMGIDVAIKKDGKWIPIQIKSNPKFCVGLKNVDGCENWCVSLNGKKLIINKY